METMLSEAHNKIQNVLEARPRASCSRQVQGCKSRVEELEHSADGMRKEQEGTQWRLHSLEDDTCRTTHKHNSKRGKARPRARQKENAKVISTCEGGYRVTNAKKKEIRRPPSSAGRTEDHTAAHVCKHMNLRVAPSSDVCDPETMKQSISGTR